MPATLEPRTMGRKAQPQKTVSVRLTEDAVKWARIASGYTGESMAEYASRVVAERGKLDAERLHAEATGKAASGGGEATAKGRGGKG